MIITIIKIVIVLIKLKILVVVVVLVPNNKLFIILIINSFMEK